MKTFFFYSVFYQQRNINFGGFFFSPFQFLPNIVANQLYRKWEKYIGCNPYNGHPNVKRMKRSYLGSLVR